MTGMVTWTFLFLTGAIIQKEINFTGTIFMAQIGLSFLFGDPLPIIMELVPKFE
jgi:hypothetical protein